MTPNEIMEMHPCLNLEDFGMTSDDGAVIIYKSGIQKLIDTYKIRHEIIDSDLTPYQFQGKKSIDVAFAGRVVVKGRAYAGNVPKAFMSTTGSCHHKNSDYNYELEVAELRAVSRLVRKITGLFGEKIISADEYYEGKRKGNAIVHDMSREVSTESAERTRESIKQKLKGLDSKRSIPAKVAGGDQ